jgi:sugar phosphate isomerase/epimerase
MSKTRTGGFDIGFRRGWGDWQADTDSLISWALDNEFSAIDVGRSADDVRAVTAAGLRVGSADLLEWQKMISADADTRAEAIAANTAYIRECAAIGPVNHFIVLLPEDPAADRADNLSYAVASFRELAPVFEACDAKLVVEGWPGPGALACTPEGYRAFIEQVDSPAIGVNYDPSHLIRMQIDPINFLREFIDRVFHVHGKDTEINGEHLYEYGNLQPATLASGVGFGEMVWRYTIPGHGEMRWLRAFQLLADAGYSGCVSIELEDANFNGSENGEKAGLIFGRRYLESC